jgi:hypothetical protein
VRFLRTIQLVFLALLYASCYLLVVGIIGPVLTLALGVDRAEEIAEDFLIWKEMNGY